MAIVRHRIKALQHTAMWFVRQHEETEKQFVVIAEEYTLEMLMEFVRAKEDSTDHLVSALNLPFMLPRWDYPMAPGSTVCH